MGGEREERGGRGGRAVHAGRERKAAERQLPAGRWMPGFPGAESPEDSGLGERVTEGALKGRRRRGEVARSRPLGPTPVWAARARIPAPPGVSPCVQPAAPRARDQRDPIDGGDCPQALRPSRPPRECPLPLGVGSSSFRGAVPGCQGADMVVPGEYRAWSQHHHVF